MRGMKISMAASNLCSCFHSLRSRGYNLSTCSTWVGDLHCQKKAMPLLQVLPTRHFPKIFTMKLLEAFSVDAIYLKLRGNLHLLHLSHNLLGKFVCTQVFSLLRQSVQNVAKQALSTNLQHASTNNYQYYSCEKDTTVALLWVFSVQFHGAETELL